MELDFSDLATLLIHAGELADVRALLSELGVVFEERLGPPTCKEREADCDVVIATPRRMLELVDDEAAPTAVRIAILAGDERAVRRIMQRDKVEFVVRRPVHPAALRLLILHVLYRGPEKRNVRRVTVGAPIRFKLGWRWRSAVLMDLSIGGCRILSPQWMQRGDRIAVKFQKELTGHRRFQVVGRVLRRRPAGGGQPNLFITALRFERLDTTAASRLEATVDAYGTGPAALPRSSLQRIGFKEVATAVTRSASDLLQSDEPAANAPDSAAAKHEPAPPTRGVRGDRRSYGRRVIALCDEHSRVLIGRDLSVGGMRVESHPDLQIGDRLAIALHVQAGKMPLVVNAEVVRDDGERGVALQFRDLSANSRSYLARMVDGLPHIQTCGPNDEAVGLVVSEILEETDA
ncbi:MAG: PilZ domain-containing protein [Myxococcota bacterium]